MQILNNTRLTNKQLNIKKFLQKTLIEQSFKLSYGSKLLTLSKENLMSISISRDLAFPEAFFKKSESFMALQQNFDGTPLYKPLLPKKIRQFFLSHVLEKLLKQNNITLLPGLVFKVGYPQKVHFYKFKNPSVRLIVWFGVLGIVFKKSVYATINKNVTKKTKNLNVVKPLLGQRVLLPVKTVNLKTPGIAFSHKLLIKNKV